MPSKVLLPETSFDIYERVHLADTDKDIEIVEETELTPRIKMLMGKDTVQLVGHLLLKIKYVGGDTPWVDNEFQHSIPVEINLPANRVMDARLLDADIQNFSIERMGPRSLNVTGVLKVYEKEQIKVESSKVKLPKEIAEALEEFYRCDESNRDIVTAVLGSANSKAAITLRYYFCKDDGHFNLLLEVLVNGFEVEETPEDKVREYYNSGKRGARGDDWDSNGYQRALGVIETLNLLNIKIKGVNAE